jgi:anti-sigma regulatory factor (Ser/Thr protein kinase)
MGQGSAAVHARFPPLANGRAHVDSMLRGPYRVTAPQSQQTAYLELGFSPNIDLVSIVRTFVTEFYNRVLNDTELSSRVAVASHELLENAVKYSTDGDTRMRIEVAYDADRAVVQLEMKNRASRENVENLTRLFGELANMKPDAFYLALMERSLGSKHGSCLGIGRVAAEADMTLKLDVTGDWVCVRALTTQNREAAA